jgi:hypothetical protein
MPDITETTQSTPAPTPASAPQSSRAAASTAPRRAAIRGIVGLAVAVAAYAFFRSGTGGGSPEDAPRKEMDRILHNWSVGNMQNDYSAPGKLILPVFMPNVQRYEWAATNWADDKKSVVLRYRVTYGDRQTVNKLWDFTLESYDGKWKLGGMREHL